MQEWKVLRIVHAACYICGVVSCVETDDEHGVVPGSVIFFVYMDVTGASFDPVASGGSTSGRRQVFLVHNWRSMNVATTDVDRDDDVSYPTGASTISFSCKIGCSIATKSGLLRFHATAVLLQLCTCSASSPEVRHWMG